MTEETFNLNNIVTNEQDRQQGIALRLMNNAQTGPAEDQLAWQREIETLNSLTPTEARLVLGQLEYIDTKIRRLIPGFVDVAIDMLIDDVERDATIHVIRPFLPDDFEI